MRHVILVAQLEGFDVSELPDAEVWGVNRTFQIQKGVTRTYFMDDLECFTEEFVTEVNETGCQVIARKHYPEIPKSEPFPLDAVITHFHGLRYFTCTVAYMIAHALYEGVDKLTLYGMYHPSDSLEYMHHIPCINFWVGVAMGMPDLLVEIGSHTLIARPYPWQPKLYGYVKQRNEELANQTITCAYRASLGYPICFTDKDGKPFEAQQQLDAVVGLMPAGGNNMQLVEIEG